MPSPLCGTAIAIAPPSALTARGRLIMAATGADPAAAVRDKSSITSIRPNAVEQMHLSICSGRRQRMGKRKIRQSATAGCKQRLRTLYIVRPGTFAFCLPFYILPRYPAVCPVLIRTRQALVKCKICGAKTPSLTRGVPVLPARVFCSVCGTKRVYRPSEVFIGNPPRIWKREALG
jgi:hypothetical protein